MALKLVRTFDFSNMTRAAFCVSRFERNVAQYADTIDKTKADRFRTHVVEPGGVYNAQIGEFVLAGAGATIYLPEPLPSLDGLDIALSARDGVAVTASCPSGKAIVRGVSSYTYSSVGYTRFLCSGEAWY